MFHKILIFLAGCSYGLIAIFLKKAYAAGYTVNEVLGAQACFGLAMLVAVTCVVVRQKVNIKTALKLIAVGTLNGFAGISFSESVVLLPASVSIVIMFQFTWIGVIIEAIEKRKLPCKKQLSALPVLFIGTIMASGIFSSEPYINFIGFIYAFTGAVMFALFIFYSGKVANNISPLIRSSWIGAGFAMTIFLVYKPDFIITGVLPDGLFLYGIELGLCAVVLPTIFLATGVPFVGAGLASILGSSELPVTVIGSALFLNESISFVQWMGVTLILIGIALPQLSLFTRRTQ